MHAWHSRYVYGSRGLMKRSEILMQSAVTAEAQALSVYIQCYEALVIRLHRKSSQFGCMACASSGGLGWFALLLSLMQQMNVPQRDCQPPGLEVYQVAGREIF